MRPHPIPPHKGEGRASRSRGDAPRGNAARLAPPPLSQIRGSPHPAAFASLRSASAATLPFGEGWSERRRIGFTSRSQPPHYAHSLRDAPCLVHYVHAALIPPPKGEGGRAERGRVEVGNEMTQMLGHARCGFFDCARTPGAAGDPTYGLAHETPPYPSPQGGGKSEPLARRCTARQCGAACSTSPFATSRQPPPGRLRFAALRFGGHPPLRGGMERAEKNRFHLTLTASALRSQPPRRALSCPL